MSVSAPSPSLGRALLGRTFLHPALDYLLIGGGLSLLTTAVLFAVGFDAVGMGSGIALAVLLANNAHFAASTVRLYSKPRARAELPFLTLGLPLVMVVVLGACVLYPTLLGRHLYALYLTWSPYHYAAQTYGLAVMYCMRSGFTLDATQKRWLRWTCLFPFFYVVTNYVGSGLDWLLPDARLQSFDYERVRSALALAFLFLSVVSPIVLTARTWIAHRRPMPMISLLVIVSNGIWWLVLSPLKAFVWATIFHGIQYMAIVMIFHARERVALEPGGGGPLRHALWFYAISVGLGYGLFYLLPQGVLFAGGDWGVSLLMVVASINIHHFIVDAFIWRLREQPNRRLVGQLAPSR